MTFRDLVFKNFRMNIKKYGMYLFSIIFSVFTIYTFLSLANSTDILNQYGENAYFLSVFNSFAYILLFFLFFYLKYINGQFLKQRKKEIATYSLFGMSNFKNGMMLFIENLIIGMIGLLIGIGVGILFYRLITLVFLNVAGASMSRAVVGFEVSYKALTTTIVVFMTYFIIIGLFSFATVYRSKLLDLFQATKSSEKKIKGSWILLILSFVILGIGYGMACSNSAVFVLTMAFPIMFLCIIGTFLFFISGIQIIINFLRKRKWIAFHGDNLLVLSSFRHKLRSNAFMISAISIVSAIAITAISTVYSMYYSAEKQAYSVTLYDIVYEENSETVDYGDRIQKALERADRQMEEEYTLQAELLKVTGTNTDLFDSNATFAIISNSTYQQFSKAVRHVGKKIEVEGEDAILIENFFFTDEEDMFDGIEIMSGDEVITLDGYEQNLIVTPNGSSTNESFIIVGDPLYQRLKEKGLLEVGASYHYINYTNPISHHEALDEFNTTNYPYAAFAYDGYYAMMNMFGTLVFIGVFVGLVFLISTATLLYFKVMSDIEEDQDYYRLLSNIGITEKRKRSIVRKHIIPIFALPLLFAIVHSIFAMKTVSTVFAVWGISVVEPAIIMFGLYIVIYFVFCMITIRHYNKKLNG